MSRICYIPKRDDEMRLQLLVPTMNATDFSKVEEMNLRNTDVIFANQTDHCSCETQIFPDRNVSATMVSTNTTGVSLNRNIALAHADAAIIMFSDDDQQFTDDFAQTVLQEFQAHPEADVIKFSCRSTNPKRPLAYQNPSVFCRGTFRTMMSAGVPALALRRERFQKFDIAFANHIGPGRELYCGEDSIFIGDLLRSRLKIYRSPALISYIRQGESSWFQGYDARFFFTGGFVYARVYGPVAPVMMLRKAWKLRHKTDLSVPEMIRQQYRGMKLYRT